MILRVMYMTVLTTFKEDCIHRSQPSTMMIVRALKGALLFCVELHLFFFLNKLNSIFSVSFCSETHDFWMGETGCTYICFNDSILCSSTSLAYL
jgi:hypothetical protein